MSPCNECKEEGKRYAMLLEFVKTLAKERPENDPFLKYIDESARDLLKRIGEL